MMLSKKKIFSIAATFVMMLFCSTIQGQNISFSSTNITLEKVLKEIQEQTEYVISYPEKSIDLQKHIVLTKRTFSLEDILERIFHKSDFNITKRDKYIIIVPAKAEVNIITEIAEPEAEAPKLSQAEMEKIAEEIKAVTDSMRIDLKNTEAEYLSRKPQYEEKILLEPVLNTYSYQSENEGIYTSPTYISNLPKIAFRTNLLYGIGTLTPNIGVELGLKPQTSLLITGSYNKWKLSGYSDNNEKLWHSTVSAEYRYWFCERFNGHFLGVHAFYGFYNISGKKIPFLFEKGSEDFRYQGYGIGGGISYGYQFMLNKHWNIELNAGIGIGVLNYDKWECHECGEVLEEDVNRFFFAPTKLGVSLIYVY